MFFDLDLYSWGVRDRSFYWGRVVGFRLYGCILIGLDSYLGFLVSKLLV